MKTLAAIDIGTHSVRLVVVEIAPDGTWTTLDESKEYVRLGEGEFVGGRHMLTSDALDRCALVCGRFGEIAKRLGADEVTAFATAAAREAGNQDELIERLSKASDGMVNVRVISGHEEARLIYLGVRSGIEMAPDEQALFMDIGGGSTELIIADRQSYSFLDSLKLGAIRLTGEAVPTPELSVSDAEWSNLQRIVRLTVEPAARSIKQLGFTKMYGSSGTIMSIAEIASRSREGAVAPKTLRNYELTLAEIQSITDHLRSLPLDLRRKVPGLGVERADIVIAGSAILQTVMETVGAHSIIISDRGLREGIVVDYIEREGAAVGISDPNAPGKDVSVRLRSVRRLMRRTTVDEQHALTVARLATQLFDQTGLLGLHSFSAPERELLFYSALLHDCGFFVAHTSHHQHSYYLIRHSELLGFDDLEVEILALVALYHRKALPKDKNAAYGRLPEDAKEIVRVLSVFVRVAEALDRTHLDIVRAVRLERTSDPELVHAILEVAPGAELSLEIWAAQGQNDALRKTLGIGFSYAPHAALQLV